MAAVRNDAIAGAVVKVPPDMNAGSVAAAAAAAAACGDSHQQDNDCVSSGPIHVCWCLTELNHIHQVDSCQCC